MTITAFSASPRNRSNSDVLADALLEGAATARNDVRTEKHRLRDYRIEPCTACDVCQERLDTPCVIDDDMQGLIDALLGSDVIVLASPVYFFSVSAQLKLFLDRSYALGGGGRWDALAGRKFAGVLTYGDSDPLLSGVSNAVGTFRDACRFLGIDLVGIVHASCDKPGEVASNAAAIEKAHALGARCVAAGL